MPSSKSCSDAAESQEESRDDVRDGNTLFVNIASGDDTEDGAEKEQSMARRLVQGVEFTQEVDETDAQGPGRELVQVVHAERAQELREVRKKFVDDVHSEMTDVKNELLHVRVLLGVLVRRERFAQTKAEIAARKLDRCGSSRTEVTAVTSFSAVGDATGARGIGSVAFANGTLSEFRRIKATWRLQHCPTPRR